MYAQAAAAGWREHLPFGGWGSAEAAARAKAEGWKGGSAPGEEGGLGVTNSQKSSSSIVALFSNYSEALTFEKLYQETKG